jgi:transcriptional regulator with XRE-family HTH domain
MKTLQQVATTLRNRVTQLKLTQERLGTEAGVSRQTLTKVLSGRADLKVTTLLALADRLGLEVMLVPKDLAPGMATDDESRPRIKSIVDVAIEELGMKPNHDTNQA